MQGRPRVMSLSRRATKKSAGGLLLASVIALLLASCAELVGIEEVQREPEDAPVTCLQCDGRCALLDTQDACGACARSCGEGACFAGMCDRRMRSGPSARSICFRGADEVLRCRGANTSGQLGRGFVSVAEPTWQAPLLDGDGSDALFASTNDDASCFVRASGELLCAGALGELLVNSAGEPPVSTPVVIPSLTPPIRELALGPRSEAGAPLCVLDDSGYARCWGLGDSDAPQVLGAGGPRQTQLAVGAGFVCVLDELGGVRCLGVVGDPSVAPHAELQPVSAPRARSLAAGALAACLIDEAGAVFCWGSSHDGQRGDGSRREGTTDTPAPLAYPLDAPAVQVVGGLAHFCALDEGGGVTCWGSAVSVGDGLTFGPSCSAGPCRPFPERVPLSNIVELSATARATFARRSDGTLYAWGESSAEECLFGEICAPTILPLPQTMELP